MQSEVILLSNVKQDNLAELIQKQFGLFGIGNVKGKRIDATEEAVSKHVAESLSEYNIILIIGGTDSKSDYMTVRSVAGTIGFETVMKDGELFPKGAEILRNKPGKPSGCAISQGNQCIMMLPGDSDTVEFMLCYRVSRYLAGFIGGNYTLRTVRAAGISKLDADDAVTDAESTGCKAVVFEDDGEIAVSVYSTGDTPEDAKSRNTSEVKNIIAAFGASAYAIDAENVGQALEQELRKKDLTVAIGAEGIDRNRVSQYSKAFEYRDRTEGSVAGLDEFELPQKPLSRNGRNSDWAAGFLAGEAAKSRGSNLGIAVTADRARPNAGANIAVTLGDNLWTEKISSEYFEELVKVACERAAHLARKVVSAYPKTYEGAVSLKDAISGKVKMNTASTNTNKKWYAKFIPLRGDSKRDIIRKSIFLLCVVVFLGSMGYLSTKVVDSANHRNLAATLQEMLNMEAPSDWEYLDKLYGLYHENNDLIAYIKIDGTNVDYPVVQTMRAGDKGETGQYYLRKDFYGNYSMYGTPFVDYRCNVEPGYETKNIIVYGHNIYDDGQMFANLTKYEKLSYYKDHPVVHFDTLYGEGDYFIIGAIVANAYAKDGPIWDYNNFIDGTEEETEEFMKQVAKRTLIVTGVDYNTSDTYLTLSTCSYKFKDARIVIVARKLRDGESISDLDVSKAYYNKNPLMPDAWYAALSAAQQSESDASFGDPEDVSSNTSSDPNALINGTVKKVALIEEPNVSQFTVGDKVSLEGMVLRITYVDENGETQKRDLTYEECITYGIIDESVLQNLKAGTYNLEFSYGGASTYYSIVINEKVLEPTVAGISEYRKSFENLSEGDRIDFSKLYINVTMSDGTVKQVPLSECEVSGIQNGGTFAAGNTKITVKYQDLTLSFTATVNKKAPTTYEISVPAQTMTEGDKINFDNIKVTVVMSDGTTRTVKLSECQVDGIKNGDTVKAGEAEYTVTYDGQTAKIKIKVSAKPSSSSSSESKPESSSSESSKPDPEPINPEGDDPSSAETETQAQAQAQSNSVLSAPASAKSVSSYYEQSLSDTMKVNGSEISVYDAVCRVVQYEAGNAAEEYVKAQAVASYTYLRNQGSSASATMSKASSVTDKTKRLVAEVIGYAVLDDSSNKYILATYFSSGPGSTLNAKDVWGGANRNLQAVYDSPEETPVYKYKISSSEFKSKMGTAYDLSGDPSDWISIKSYFPRSEYVEYVSIGGQSVKARTLREQILGGSNLRSVAFEVDYDESTDKFIFTSYGYGHGVGMSAQGAIVYANKGYDWDEILLKYYSNCYIGMKY